MDPSTEVTSSAPAATTEPATVVTEAPKTKAEKRAAIVKAVRAAQAVPAATETTEPAAAASPAATPPTATSPAITPTVPADTGLADRIAALEAELNETRGKLTEREKVRAAPADVEGLLDLMSELGDVATMEKVSEAFLRRQDSPEHKAVTAAEKRLAAIEAKIAEGEKAEKERAARAAAEASEAEGHKVARRVLDEGKARWPRLTRDERNIVEAIPEAAERAAKKLGGKNATTDQRLELFKEALDEVEKDRAERYSRYALPDIARKPTITNAASSTGTIPQPREDKPKTHAQKRAELIARVRAGQPSTT